MKVRSRIQSVTLAVSEPEEESNGDSASGRSRTSQGWCSKAASEARKLPVIAGRKVRSRPGLRSGHVGSTGPVVRAGCAPLAFAVTVDSGPSQSRRWHPARNTRHGPIRKVACRRRRRRLPSRRFLIGSHFRRGRGVFFSLGKPLPRLPDRVAFVKSQ